MSKMARKVFTQEEKELLIDFVRDNKSILENKTNHARIVSARIAKWKELSEMFAAYGHQRDWRRLKECYQRLKNSAKTAVNKYKKYQRGTGGGPSNQEEPSDIDWAIFDICPLDFEEDHNESDSDRREARDQQQVSTFVLDPESEILHIEHECSGSKRKENSAPGEVNSLPSPKKKRMMSSFQEEMLLLNKELNQERIKTEKQRQLHLFKEHRQKMATEELLQEKIRLEILLLKKKLE